MLEETMRAVLQLPAPSVDDAEDAQREAEAAVGWQQLAKALHALVAMAKAR